MDIDLRRVAAVEVDTHDTLFLDGLSEGWYAVTNTRQQVGFGLAWPLEVFPALWFWQVYGGAHGPPWYGRTYNIALEPFSSVQATLPVTSSLGVGAEALGYHRSAWYDEFEDVSRWYPEVRGFVTLATH